MRPKSFLFDFPSRDSRHALLIGLLAGALLGAAGAYWLTSQQNQEISPVFRESATSTQPLAWSERGRESSTLSNPASPRIPSTTGETSALNGVKTQNEGTVVDRVRSTERRVSNSPMMTSALSDPTTRQEGPFVERNRSTESRVSSAAPTRTTGLNSPDNSAATALVPAATDGFVAVEISPANPLVRQSANLLNSGQLDAVTANALQRARQDFDKEIATARSATDPTSEEYFNAWQQASARSDYALKAWLGWSAFNALSLEAQQQAATSAVQPGGSSPAVSP
jgi:hypothetical protein